MHILYLYMKLWVGDFDFRFLKNMNSGTLRCLYLSCCRFLDVSILKVIVEVCPDLEGTCVYNKMLYIESVVWHMQEILLEFDTNSACNGGEFGDQNRFF